MIRARYYEEMKRLAHEVRDKYSLTTSKVGLRSVRAIYRAERIHIDHWPHKLRRVRAAYFLIDGEAFVLINAAIKPKEPRLFCLCHELKHHHVDQDLAAVRGLGCQDVSWQDASPTEIGAEVFAAELIYPESEFLTLAENLGLNRACTKEDVVRLKRECHAPVSYAFLVKRLEWFHMIGRGEFRGVQFMKLEDEIYGPPIYRKPGFRRRPRRILALSSK